MSESDDDNIISISDSDGEINDFSDCSDETAMWLHNRKLMRSALASNRADDTEIRKQLKQTRLETQLRAALKKQTQAEMRNQSPFMQQLSEMQEPSKKRNALRATARKPKLYLDLVQDDILTFERQFFGAVKLLVERGFASPNTNKSS